MLASVVPFAGLNEPVIIYMMFARCSYSLLAKGAVLWYRWNVLFCKVAPQCVQIDKSNYRYGLGVEVITHDSDVLR